MPKESKSNHLSRRSFAAAGAAATIGSMGAYAQYSQLPTYALSTFASSVRTSPP